MSVSFNTVLVVKLKNIYTFFVINLFKNIFYFKYFMIKDNLINQISKSKKMYAQLVGYHGLRLQNQLRLNKLDFLPF